MSSVIERIARWILRYVPVNASWFVGTYLIIYLANEYIASWFGVSASNRSLAAIALVLTPASLGASAVLILLLQWESVAVKYCRTAGTNLSPSFELSVAKANDRVFRRIEAWLSKWSPLKAGVYLAFAVHAHFLARRIRFHQVNLTDSLENDLSHVRIADFYDFEYKLCLFVSSLASAPQNRQSERLLERCFSTSPLKTRSGKLQSSVLETFRDGRGFFSTLNFLFRLSLWLIQPSQARLEILRIYEGELGNPRIVGWLACRFFEYALVCSLRGVSPTAVRARLKSHSTAFKEGSARATFEELHALKYKIRDDLLEELSSC